MKELLALLRAMQLYAHSSHLLVSRDTFQQDHDFFKELYKEVENDYDDVAERIIGLFGDNSLQLQTLLQNVLKKIQDCPSTDAQQNSDFYSYQLKLEDRLTGLISNIIKAGVTPGTEQLIGDIANKSESRKYKIKQRLK